RRAIEYRREDAEHDRRVRLAELGDPHERPERREHESDTYGSEACVRAVGKGPVAVLKSSVAPHTDERDDREQAEDVEHEIGNGRSVGPEANGIRSSDERRIPSRTPGLNRNQATAPNSAQPYGRRAVATHRAIGVGKWPMVVEHLLGRAQLR